MTDRELRRLVQEIARRHVESAHPERLEELETVFDSVYARALAGARGGPAPRGTEPGLPFDLPASEVSLVAFTVLSAVQLVQTLLLRRRLESRAAEPPADVRAELREGLAEDVAEALEELKRSSALSRPREEELERIAAHVVRTVEEERRAMVGPPSEPVRVAALQLLVRRDARAGRPLLEFSLHGQHGERAYVHRSFGETLLSREPQAYFGELLDRMVVRATGDEGIREGDEEWVRRRGAHLFETFLPVDLQSELRILARAGGELLVISGEPWIPWELLKFPAAPGDGEGRFLAEAFALARWRPGSAPPARLPLRRLAVVRSRRSDLERAAEEVSRLMGLAESSRRRVEAVEAAYLPLTDAMARGRHDGWHFIGHGDRSRAGPEWWTLALDDRTLTPQDLSDEVALGLGRRRPLVFLNACRVAGSAPGLVGLGGWPARFLQVGAGAFLGPLWAVPSDRAAVFSGLFYDRLVRGESIGEAVRRARLELRERSPGDPTWLAYALYADPGARVAEVSAARPARPDRSSRGVNSTRPAAAPSGKAWSGKREYGKLARRISETSGDEYEALVVRLLRAALGSWDEELLALGGGLWAVGLEPPYPVLVQILHFEAPGEALGPEEAARSRDALVGVRRAALDADELVVLHNRHGGSSVYREEVGAQLRELTKDGTIGTAVLWDYQQLLRRAFSGMHQYLVSEARRRSLSLQSVEDVLGSAPGREPPLEQVPLRRSTLVANQYRLIREEEVESSVADPAAEVVAGEERSVTLLLGAFGFGKTTALARALLGHEKEIFFVPAAGISEEVHGAKHFLSLCVDVDRLLDGIPEEERDDYRLLARPAIEYAFKKNEIDAVLVLDGLDESPFLARPGGLQNLVNNLWDLRAPVVLSMRTEFWDDKRQDFQASFGDRAAHGEPRLQRLRKVELLPWGDGEIREFLERFAAAVKEREDRRRVEELTTALDDGRFEEVYGDIPRRPLFLRMIADTVADAGLPGDHVGRAQLMADAARLKVQRDVTAPRRDGGAGRPSILARPMTVAQTVELAWEAMVAAAARMTREEEGAFEILPDCSYESVRSAVPRLREVDEPLPLFLHSLLHLSGPRTGLRPARLRFAHRAFQEFFLAWHLVDQGGERGPEPPEAVAAWMADIRRDGLAGAR
ncbi:MAG: CHAT domain-containing protein [Thermoanaerobaculia bacterium]